MPIDLPEPAGYPDWFAQGAAQLVAMLRTADPEAPLWAWGGFGHARFWSRRMLHENAVHRADAELAAGIAPQFDQDTALDAIDEVLTILPHLPRAVEELAQIGQPGQTLHLHATDAPGEWLITLQDKAFRFEHGHTKADVAVRGSISDLLLLLYRRQQLVPERYEVFGDQDLLARWLTHTAF